MTPRTIRNWFAAGGRESPARQARERKRRRLEDADFLRRQFVGQRQTPSEIAKLVGATTSEVQAALERFGIDRPHENPRLRPEALQQAFASGETVRSIATAAGAGPGTVRRAMRDAGIDNPRKKPEPKIDAIHGEWLHRRYETEGASKAALAAELNMSDTSVTRSLERHGIASRPQGGPPGGLDLDWLEERRREGATQQQIADEAGVSPTTVSRALRRRWQSAASGSRCTEHSSGLTLGRLRTRYVSERASVETIAEENGLAARDVWNALRYYGIHRSRPRSGEAPLEDEEWRRQRYVDDGCGIGTIAAELGVPPRWVRSALQRHQLRA